MGYAVWRGRQGLRDRSAAGAPSARALLGGPAEDRPIDVGVYVHPALLADLHAPDLVITPHYVGPQRRRTDRHHPVPARRRPASGHGRSLRLVEAVAVVVISLVVAVPLTWVAARQPSQARPTSRAAAGSAAGTPPGSARRGSSTAAPVRPGASGASAVSIAQHAARQATRVDSRASHLQAMAAARSARQAARAAHQASGAHQRAARAARRSSGVRRPTPPG